MMNDRGLGFFQLFKSLLLVSISVVAVYLISFLFFGIDGLTFLAAFHIVPFIIFFNLGYDDPNNTSIIMAYVLSFVVTVFFLTLLDWGVFNSRIKKKLIRSALILVFYFLELGLLSSLLLLQ